MNIWIKMSFNTLPGGFTFPKKNTPRETSVRRRCSLHHLGSVRKTGLRTKGRRCYRNTFKGESLHQHQTPATASPLGKHSSYRNSPDWFKLSQGDGKLTHTHTHTNTHTYTHYGNYCITWHLLVGGCLMLFLLFDVRVHLLSEGRGRRDARSLSNEDFA